MKSKKTKVIAMTLSRIASCLVLLLAGAHAQSLPPKQGFAPDSLTAVKIAEAVLIPIYGKEEVESGFAFMAVLNKGVWTVGWNLDCPEDKSTTCVGGTAEVKLRKADGRIVNLVHTH